MVHSRCVASFLSTTWWPPPWLWLEEWNVQLYQPGKKKEKENVASSRIQIPILILILIPNLVSLTLTHREGLSFVWLLLLLLLRTMESTKWVQYWAIMYKLLFVLK